MLGGEQESGFVQLSLKDIFDYKFSVREEQTIKVYVSYLEIYNENLIDLLNPKGDHSQLKVNEDEKVVAASTARHRHQRLEAAKSQEHGRGAAPAPVRRRVPRRSG